jgi:DNA-binding LacI/PurR family transcriptional regulator
MGDGYDAAAYFMQQQNAPDAIMAATDFMAIGALNYLNEHGISVPEMVAVVGFDNLTRSAETNPPLTTIELPLEQLATKAIESLIFQIENDKKNIQQVFDCKFIVRQST